MSLPTLATTTRDIIATAMAKLATRMLVALHWPQILPLDPDLATLLL